MNERIKQLAEQARNYALDQRRIYERVHNTEQCMENYCEVYNEKFAQLIVRDVLVICDAVSEPFNDPNMDKNIPGALIVAEMIRENFGVEE